MQRSNIAKTLEDVDNLLTSQQHEIERLRNQEMELKLKVLTTKSEQLVERLESTHQAKLNTRKRKYLQIALDTSNEIIGKQNSYCAILKRLSEGKERENKRLKQTVALQAQLNDELTAQNDELKKLINAQDELIERSINAGGNKTMAFEDLVSVALEDHANSPLHCDEELKVSQFELPRLV